MTSKQYNKQSERLESRLTSGKLSEEEYAEISEKLEIQRLVSLENELDIDWVEDDPTEWMGSDF